MLNSFHNPDILTCLANLSSDEVFTPPNVANQILDTLPDELWSDKTVTFLDPVSKSGVFLREITKIAKKSLRNSNRHSGILKNKKAYVQYEPLGVAGIISPWNYPFVPMVPELTLKLPSSIFNKIYSIGNLGIYELNLKIER